MIKIKILNADKDLEGKTLFLEETADCIYTCKKTGVRIIDSLMEFELMNQQYAESGLMEFQNLLLLSDSFEEVQFIEAIKYLK